MSLLRTFGAAVLLTAAAASANANASSFIVTTDTVVGAVAASTDATSDISSSFKDDKIVRAARDDAASFVASAGDIRGAQLEGAFQHIRQQLPELHATDAQLAQAILAI
ncbi:DUF2388 domain-containing protein [Pseudomonas viridiflava]|uniref:DUF2388 domain-containing protein n=1 Tax=Pseudomonas viridiflava TaxID=33069 RepID=UPI000F01399C|nr:DUF2388 domain-containing protein [Pseudomonas viridiflava]